MSASAVAERVAESSTTPLSGSPTTVKDALSAIAAWIPAEALGVYTVGYGILLLPAGSPPPATGDAPPVVVTLAMFDRWLVFAISAAVCIFLIVLQACQQLRSSNQAQLPETHNSFRRRLFLSIGLSLFALVVYVANIPGHPFVQILDGFNPAIPAFAAVILAVVIPGLAWFGGVTKPK